jgi:V8-like Glu-specific endopeptidase
MQYFSLKASVSLAIIFTILFTSSCQKSRNEQILFVRNSVVSFELRWNTDKKKLSAGHYGTGFFISDNLIITAFHVSKQLEAERAKVSTKFVEIVIEKHSNSSEEFFAVPVKLEITDEENDLAIFSFEPLEIKKQWENFVISPLPLAETVPEIGDEVTLTGFFEPYVYPFSSVGTIAMITENNFSPPNGKDKVVFNKAVFLDLTSLPGHSGGPVYSFKSENVVGISVRVLNPNDDRVRSAIATNSIHLRTLLELLKIRNAEQQNYLSNQSNAQSN